MVSDPAIPSELYSSYSVNLISLKGCCISSNRTSSGVSPYGSDIRPGSSSRAIAAPSRAEASTSSAAPSTSNLPSRAPDRAGSSTETRPATLGEHLNRPLRPHIWQSSKRTWSRGELERERTEFFDTRVTGRAEIWTALKTVIELLDEDLETAQTILDAAGITLPTGDLANGAYDEPGNFYHIPEHIVSPPTNVVDDPNPESLAKTCESGDSDADQNSLKRREEKGKTVIDPAELISVTARLSDRGGPDVVISLSKEQTVRTLIHKIQEEVGIFGKGKIRIAYLGKILHESESLAAQGWRDGHVVNALVFQ